MVRHLSRDGNRLLREHADSIGLDPSFTVLDRADAADGLNFVRNELGLAKTEARLPRKDTCLAIYSAHGECQMLIERDLGKSAFLGVGMGS